VGQVVPQFFWKRCIQQAAKNRADLVKRILAFSTKTEINSCPLSLHEIGDNMSLVILDLIMPEMGGKQSLEELLKINPHVKVLIASGYSTGGETKKTIESGAGVFVRKPYEVRGLLEAARRVLDA